jgi:drug/metabolite transporter (DMT)-like permease
MEANMMAMAVVRASSTTMLASSSSSSSTLQVLLPSSSSGIIASWYTASLANNFATPALLDLLDNSPITLNILEQTAMIFVALIVLPANQIELIPTKETIKKVGGIIPILAMGLANAITARLFMISLQHLPLSLCHTIRACSPCVAAGIGLVRGKRFSPKQLSSLPIIVAGFSLAVSAVQPSSDGSNSNSIKVGVYAAIGSLLAMSALQHISKVVLERGMHEMQCQFLQCTLCLFFLVGSNYNNNYQCFCTVRDLAMNNNKYHNGGGVVGGGGGGGAISIGQQQQQQFCFLTLLNGAGDYIENVSATKACAIFDELTFSVFDTLRRLSVILICGFLVRKNPAHFSNISGTVLVLVGALLYQQGSSNISSNSSNNKQ